MTLRAVSLVPTITNSPASQYRRDNHPDTAIKAKSNAECSKVLRSLPLFADTSRVQKDGGRQTGLAPAAERTRNRRNLTSLFGLLLVLGGLANSVFVDRPRATAELDRVLSSEVDTALTQLDGFSASAAVALRTTARQPDLAEALRLLRPPSTRLGGIEAGTDNVRTPAALAPLVRASESLSFVKGFASLGVTSVTMYALDGTPIVSTDGANIEAGAAADRRGRTAPGAVRRVRETRVGTITTSKPRLSSTDEWVIALATPVSDERGRVLGTLEGEVRLEGLRRSFGGRVYPTMLIDESRHAVDVDSRFGFTSNVGPGSPAGSFTDTFPAGAVRGSKTVDGNRMSWFRIEAEGSENQWILAVADPVGAHPFDGFGISTLGPLFTGLILLVISVLSARSERRRLEHAMTDELTGLPSRRLLKDRLHQAVLNAKRGRPDAEVALLVLDLDRFKEVNDALGHSLGDRLLVEVSHRLRAVLRENDTIARLGGDEFAVVVATDHPSGEIEVVEKLLATFAQPVALDGLLLTVAASVGIARFPADGDDPERLLRCADVAMYQSKRNRLPWVRYAVETDPSDPARLEMLSDLRSAIGTSQLELHYQPKVNLVTDEVIGAEALLRWTHPTKGPIAPDTFISIAEQTGVIAPLTDDVLRKAARQLRQWLSDGRDFSVSVNISAANLTEGEFVERVRQIVTEEDAPAEFMVLELTESAVMSDHRRGLEVLHELSAIGFRLSIDDFGTGYSSLSYLQRLPVDELKIDRSFVKTLVDDQVNRSIVRSTVDLGHNLGLSVVAEGVEDEATQHALAELGCDAAQGYFLSRPLPAPAFIAWLDARVEQTPAAPNFRTISLD